MKTKHLLAAALVAVGVSAQAGQANLGTYAVVTLPAAAGYNFYGFAVQKDSNTTWSQYLVLNDGDTFSVIEEGTEKAGSAVPTGSAYWVNVDSSKRGSFYQFGADPGANAETTYTIPAGTTMPASFTHDVTLDDFTDALSATSYTLNTKKANSISIWNVGAQAYETYWYCTKNGGAWKKGTTAVEADSITIKAGQGVYIYAGTLNQQSLSVTL